jgi:hypothetical protein
VIGMLLDIDEASLAVYYNGTRCGLMMQLGGRFKVRCDLQPQFSSSSVYGRPYFNSLAPLFQAHSLSNLSLQDVFGNVPADLEAPLFWAVDVGFRSCFTIESKPPPVVTAEDLADDERMAQEMLARQAEQLARNTAAARGGYTGWQLGQYNVR